MNISRNSLLVSCVLLLSLSAQAKAARAQDAASHDHDKAHCDMIARGNKAMGFDAAKTTHHFTLSTAGGAIEVSANDSADSASRDEIQPHLWHIAKKFKEGDFDIPMFVHDQTPPGVPVMKRLAKEIHFNSHDTEHGGEVTITSTSPEAVRAIHDFLVFQIREHKTGDPTTLP